jgi:heat-inducible transcriptional repressor
MLNPRAAELLKLLIERYIHEGQPVASKALCRAVGESRGRDVSSATVRNVMAELDHLGLVASPHTSAGRVPTALGYRYFIDTLVQPEALSEPDHQRILQSLLPCVSAEEKVGVASQLLAKLSAMAGVVTLPKRNHATLQRIQFLRLSERKVLAILLVNQSEVQNRLIETSQDFSPDTLERLAQTLNEHCTGKPLALVFQQLQDFAQQSEQALQRFLQQTLAWLEQSQGSSQPSGYVLAGGGNLLGFQDLADVSRLKGLFDALDRQRELLDLFSGCYHAEGVQIFIGQESGYSVLDECSVVTAPYYCDGQVAGVLGVIGPTRMAYSRIIPLVSETARHLSQGLQ